MHPFFRQTVLGLGCICLLVLPSAALAVQPDYEAARDFGIALGRDYATKRGQAIVDCLDEEAIRRRVFSAYKWEPTNSPEMMKLWSDVIFRGVKQEMFSLGEYKVLVVQRVVRVDGARAIQCLLTNETGSFRIITLRLRSAADGVVKIEDITAMGSTLEMTRRIRQTFLILGGSSTTKLDPEETELELYSRGYQLSMRMGLESMAKGKYDEAFSRWKIASPDLRSTRIWKEFRNAMAMGGSAEARKDLEEESLRDGSGGDPMVRLATTNKNKDFLRAVNDILVAQYELVFFRIIKAGILLEKGNAADALSLARDICQTSPASVGAYEIAVKAAVRLSQPRDAMDLLQQWSKVDLIAHIDEELGKIAELNSFRQSAEYQQWKKSTPADSTAG